MPPPAPEDDDGYDPRREPLEALLRSTPEWEARASEVARSGAPFDGGGAVLGLFCGFEPETCRVDDAGCKLRCDSLRMCSGCAGGRWLTVTIGTAKQTVHMTDEDFESPTYMEDVAYGRWRNQFRTRVRKEGDAAYRTLADPKQSFPDYRPGSGQFGYGKPASISRTPPPGVADVLGRGGFAFVRIEHFGAARFPLLVVERTTPLPRSRLRAWGAELTSALGGRACELAIGHGERFQFDGFAAGSGNAGVYTFIEDGFHPWLAAGDQR